MAKGDLSVLSFKKPSTDMVDKIELVKDVPRKKRFMAGFHEYLQRHLDGNCDYEFVNVVDLGDRIGACEHCGTPIRYEFYIKSKKTGEQFILGSVCITKVEWLSQYLHLTTDEFLRILNRKAKEFKDTFRREDNREKYIKIVEFIEEYSLYKSDWKLRNVLVNINAGRIISNDDIEMVSEVIKNTNLSDMKAKFEKNIVANKEEYERRIAEKEVVRKEYEKLIDDTIQLSKLVTSKFISDMAAKLAVLPDGDVINTLPSNLTANQLTALKSAILEYDIPALEMDREATIELREEQIAVLDNIIYRVETEGHDFKFRDDKGSYLELFKSIRFRLNKRPLTEGEQSAVDKYLQKHGKDMVSSGNKGLVSVEQSVQIEREEKGVEKVIEDREKIKELLDF